MARKRDKPFNAAQARKLTLAALQKAKPEPKSYRDTRAGRLEKALDHIREIAEGGNCQAMFRTNYEGKKRPSYRKYDSDQMAWEALAQDLRNLGFKTRFGGWERKILWGDPPTYRPLEVGW